MTSLVVVVMIMALLIEPTYAKLLDKNRSAFVSRRSALISQLLQDYSRSQPPEVESGLQLRVQFALLNILDVSTAKEYIEVHGWWRMYWDDPALAWDAEEWGVKELYFSPSEIWKPDLMVVQQITEVDSSSFISVYASGSVFMSVPRTTKVGCTMNLTNYPFDSQYCSMTLGSWAHNGQVLDVVPRPIGKDFYLDRNLQASMPATAPSHAVFDLAQFRAQPNSAEFELKALRVVSKNTFYNCCPEPYPVIEIEFELQRGSLTILVGMIFPMVIVTILGFCTLWCI